MRNFIEIFWVGLVLAFAGTACSAGGSDKARVVFHLSPSETFYFQPEDSIGFRRLSADSSGLYVFEAAIGEPVYYRYIDPRQKYYTVYLEPGTDLEIVAQSEGCTFQGKGAVENEFIRTHYFLGHAPDSVRSYSDEWLHFCQRELDGLIQQLEQSGLPAGFIRQHRLYFEYAYYNQLLTGPATMRAFAGLPVDLPAEYYDFLKTVRFDRYEITRIPKWFQLMLEAFEQMEKSGFIEVSEKYYPEKYAAGIEDEKLRSRFLIRLLDLILQKGYADDFGLYLEQVKPFVGEEEEAMRRLEVRYEELKTANLPISRGKEAPDFRAVDIAGKEWTLSDFQGKVLVLDFWFTGCIPCRAEMPYMEKLAEELQGAPVCFVSMSLDSGDQLLALWREMVKDKKGTSLHLNVPGGFKSGLATTYRIRGVPRIVIIDKKGCIVDAYAKRPSDPKLRLQLKELIGR